VERDNDLKKDTKAWYLGHIFLEVFYPFLLIWHGRLPDVQSEAWYRTTDIGESDAVTEFDRFGMTAMFATNSDLEVRLGPPSPFNGDHH